MTVRGSWCGWGGVVLANSLLWLVACLAPINSPQAKAFDLEGILAPAGEKDAADAAPPAESKPADGPSDTPAEPSLDDKEDTPAPAGEDNANPEVEPGAVMPEEMQGDAPLPLPFLIGAELADDGEDSRNLPVEFRLVRALQVFTAEVAAAEPLLQLADAGNPAEAQQAEVADSLEAEKPAAEIKKEVNNEVKKAVENPIGQFFRELLPRPAIKKRVQPAAPPVPGADPALRLNGVRSPKTVETEQKERLKKESARRRQAGDPSVAYDPKKAEWMARARERIDARDWRQAFDYLQRILENPEDALYRRPNGAWTSIRQEARRLQGEAPEEDLATYRAQYAGLAQQLLSRAVQSNDVELLGKVSRFYFHTAAGYEATDRLGNVHLDRGEYGLAGRLFQSLWEVQAPPTQSRVWKFKALLAYRFAGQAEWADQLSPELSSAPAAIDIGGRPVDPRKWLEERTQAPAARAQVLSEWTMPFGNKSRTAKAAGGRPLLLSRWSLPTAQLATLRQNLTHLSEDLSDQGNVPLPGFFPIMVGDKIAFRTYRGVQVADAATGRPLWRTESEVPLEEMLSVRPDQVNNYENGRFRRFLGNGGTMGYQPFGGDSQPLCNLACRNSNFGLISSDGTRLFVLEDPQAASNRQPQYSFWDESQQITRNEANLLTAYDLATGHRIWEAGGDDFGEAFQLPLAGNFFFGPPLFDGQDLLIVGEQAKNNDRARNSEIRLYALDPASGRLKWSQLVGIAEVGIGRDMLRRWWSAQSAAGDGVIVCPTTSHWLVGVDRGTRSLLWGYQFPRLRNPGNASDFNVQEHQAMVQPMPLAGRWFASPPVISRQRVVYAPPEANLLVCLDLFTGKELWQIPRGDFLSVAGVYDDVVLLISRNVLAAYALPNGQPLWRVSTPSIVGRGIAVGDRYYLPCIGGELWNVALATGAVGEKSYLTAAGGSEGKLGNLAFHRGMLLSLSLGELTAFEQNDALRAQIADRQRQNPNDPWANLRDAEIHLLQREYAPALNSLRKISEKEMPADLVAHYRGAMIEAISRSIRADFSRDATADIRTLAELSQTSEQKLDYQRLLAERNLARKEFAAAFEIYLPLMNVATSAGPAEPLFSAGTVQVRMSAWLAGQLDDLWRNLPASQKPDLDARVQTLAKAQAGQTIASQTLFVDLFRSHPAAVPVARELIEQLAGRRDFLAAERLLLRWHRGEDRTLAAAATERLARLMLEFQLPGDAAEFYRALETRFGDVRLESGKTGAELVRGLRTESRFPVANALPDWSHRQVRVDRLGANYSEQQRQDLSRTGSRRPFFRQHLIQVHPIEQRLEIIRLDTGAQHWLLPLRSRAQGGYNGERNPVVSESSEHLLTVLHQGVLHGLSPVDRRVLWTRPVEVRGSNPYAYVNVQNPLSPMQSLGQVSRRRQRVHQTGPGGGTLAFANSEIVGYLERRSMTVLDAVTGDVLWTWDRVRPGTRVFAGPDVVYFVAPESSQIQALRAIDGQPVPIRNAGEASWNSLIELVGGRDLILPVAEGTNVTRVKRYDPLRDREVWNVSLPRGSLWSSMENDWLAILEPDGKLQTLDLTSGKLTEVAKFTAADLQNRMDSMFCFVDYDNLYFIINSAQNQNTNYQEAIPWVKASGQVYAFDLETQKQRWVVNTPGQHLMLDRIDVLPGLPFATRRYEKRGNIQYYSLNLMLIDKRTGKALVDNRAATQNGFQALWYLPAEQTIELRGYNERIRISAVDPSAVVASPTPPVKAPAVPPPANDKKPAAKVPESATSPSKELPVAPPKVLSPAQAPVRTQTGKAS